MKLATWNINSVRLRLPLVLQFLQDADIDVLCLQETKTVNQSIVFVYFHVLSFGVKLG